VALLSVAPFLYGIAHTPPGSRYLGFQYNTDDEMVYAAWMRQAMNGHFFMDNRFAVDSQPGLTANLYFFVLGLVAKVVGIPWAAALARFVFGGLFVLILNRFIGLFTSNVSYRRLALVIGCFGAGFGFMTWQPLGNDFLATSASPLKDLLLGHLPNDVWQPEGFAFSSILTNSLFSFSLCLILYIFICVVTSRESWRPVLPGALSMLILMNVHSYDVLLIALVLIGLLVASFARKQLTRTWFARVLIIGLGALPTALWFIYVLKHDPVFQARAETLTYTENFRSVLGGYGLLMIFALIGGFAWLRSRSWNGRVAAGLACGSVLFLAMFVAASQHTSGYWMSLGPWLALYALVLAIVSLLARDNAGVNLAVSWALVGLIAPYFPGLFERKLMMGLSVPWALLAAAGVYMIARTLKAGEQRWVAGLCTMLLVGSSIRWLGREFELINKDDSNTTLHTVYLSPDAVKIIDYLNTHIADQRTVILAMPGIPMSLSDVVTPLVPDLNAILSGLTGVYTYAGHWSETPDYTARRSQTSAFYFRMDKDQRAQLVQRIGANYVVAPVPEALAEETSGFQRPLRVIDESDLGTVVVNGKSLRLIKIGS
jgi:arabinosyltransferase C